MRFDRNFHKCKHPRRKTFLDNHDAPPMAHSIEKIEASTLSVIFGKKCYDLIILYGGVFCDRSLGIGSGGKAARCKRNPPILSYQRILSEDRGAGSDSFIGTWYIRTVVLGVTADAESAGAAGLVMFGGASSSNGPFLLVWLLNPDPCLIYLDPNWWSSGLR